MAVLVPSPQSKEGQAQGWEVDSLHLYVSVPNSAGSVTAHTVDTAGSSLPSVGERWREAINVQGQMASKGQAVARSVQLHF